jgi:hypothetical protein
LTYLDLCLTTIYKQFNTGNETALVRCKEGDSFSDIISPSLSGGGTKVAYAKHEKEPYDDYEKRCLSINVSDLTNLLRNTSTTNLTTLKSNDRLLSLPSFSLNALEQQEVLVIRDDDNCDECHLINYRLSGDGNAIV